LDISKAAIDGWNSRLSNGFDELLVNRVRVREGGMSSIAIRRQQKRADESRKAAASKTSKSAKASKSGKSKKADNAENTSHSKGVDSHGEEE
jgi:hypothetical protein